MIKQEFKFVGFTKAQKSEEWAPSKLFVILVQALCAGYNDVCPSRPVAISGPLIY